MADYIDREAFITDKRKQYCTDCNRRKGMKNGKVRFCYEIGDAPCRACDVDYMINDIENYPAADVTPIVRCKECDHWNAETHGCTRNPSLEPGWESDFCNYWEKVRKE